MTAAELLYSCPVCSWDPWHCTCLSKERVRRIAYVIGYPITREPAADVQAEERRRALVAHT